MINNYSQNSSVRPKWLRNGICLFAGTIWVGLLLGCGNGSDTFVRFKAGGETYVVKDPALVITRLVEGVHFFDLTYLPLSKVPGAIVQWRMKIESPEELVGQSLDLKLVDPNKVEATIFLRLTEDLTLQSRSHSNIQFKIDRIEKGYVEGSFSGTQLEYVSKKKKPSRTEDVTARFRVKLVEKDWKDKTLSRKRRSK